MNDRAMSKAYTEEGNGHLIPALSRTVCGTVTSFPSPVRGSFSGRCSPAAPKNRGVCVCRRKIMDGKHQPRQAVWKNSPYVKSKVAPRSRPIVFLTGQMPRRLSHSPEDVIHEHWFVRASREKKRRAARMRQIL